MFNCSLYIQMQSVTNIFHLRYIELHRKRLNNSICLIRNTILVYCRWKNFPGFSFVRVRATPLRSYPHFNYWYQVTCSSFRVPEQLTPVRVHRMQMSSRPLVCPSSEREKAGPLFVQRWSKFPGVVSVYVFVSEDWYRWTEHWAFEP